MQALQQGLWALEGPFVQTHVGDLAWWLSRPEGKRRLWLDGDRCLAWGWLHAPATLDYEVHRAHRAGALHHDVLAWFESEAEGSLTTYAMETDAQWLELLAARGYVRPDPYKWYAYHVHDLDDLDDVQGPDGFTLHPVRDEQDLTRRVDVHRAVWAPSRLTEQLYRRVRSVWPYRADLDCVLESPDGSFVAYVLAWYDDANRVGEFEPVGTRPEYRRQGLGSLTLRYALRRLQQEGALRAVVYAGGRDEDAGARALYESVGFRRYTRVVEFRKER
jgi:ribosomal protein S18 acetylase RimI-like enzyme